MEKKNTIDMTKGPILSAIVRFTIPIFIGDLFQQLYNIVDTMIVGRFLGSSALAAVGATGTLMFLTQGFATGLGSGCSIVTSQLFGAKNEAGMRKSFTNGVLLMGAIGAILTAACLLGMRGLLTLMNTPEDIFELSYSYISVICGGLLATIFYNLFAADLRAIGNSRIPLYFLILASVSNIIMDLLFVVVVKMGVAGAALATVLSQLLSAGLCFVYIVKKETLLSPQKGEWAIDWDIAGRQFAIGIPMAIQTGVTASGTVIVQSAMNLFGSVAVAANTAASKICNIYTQVLFSTGISISTYVGQNYGKGDYKRIVKGIRLTTILMMAYAILAGVVYNVFLSAELRLFFDAAEDMTVLMPYAKTYAKVSGLFFIALGLIFIFRSSMQGCGRSVLAMYASLAELSARVVLTIVAKMTLSYVAVCFCNAGAWIAGAVYCTTAFLFCCRSMKNMR